MNTLDEFENLNVLFNAVSIDELFKKYDEIGFIYETKKKLLAPHFSDITRNWKKLLESQEELLWIFTNAFDNSDDFASVCAWKHNNAGLIAQHLVSDGNPFLSLKVMMAAQIKAEQGGDKVISSQNWFRPNNRYAFRVFSTMVNKLGPEKSTLRLFDQLNFPLNEIGTDANSKFVIEEVRTKDIDLIKFVDTQYDKVFTKAEELDQEDINLESSTLKFARYGLLKTRRVLKVLCPETKNIIACVVANRAPIGLNFSFLENRAYYIVDSSLDIEERTAVLKTINNSIAQYYDDIEIHNIPIVTDEVCSKCLQEIGAEYLRTYMQSIWLREGFLEWFDHINSFLKRIEKRSKNMKAA